jgi:acyl carrier protein
MMQTIEEKITAIANEKLNKGSSLNVVDLERSLKDLGIDSLDFMLILIGVQEELELEIPDEITPSLTDLAKVVEYVKGVKG